MHNSIGYHTRLSGQNTVKVCGGSFGGSIDLETVNRLVRHHFTVKARPSGSLVFVDREGREVSLYISIDPEITEAGKLSRLAFRKALEAKQEIDDRKREQLEDTLSGMSVDEALDKLRT
jgi:DNA-binding protein YbaB